MSAKRYVDFHAADFAFKEIVFGRFPNLSKSCPRFVTNPTTGALEVGAEYRFEIQCALMP
jgi:hypothetical protein